MKSELGKRLQEIMDRPGVLHLLKRVVWLSAEHPGAGYKCDEGGPEDIFWVGGTTVEFGYGAPKVHRRAIRRARALAKGKKST